MLKFRLNVDGDSLEVCNLRELMEIAENDGEVLRYCYDHLESFLIWLKSVDKKKAKVFSSCKELLDEGGFEFFSLLLTSPSEWSHVEIEKAWRKAHPSIPEVALMPAVREWIVTEEDVKAAFNLTHKRFYLGISKIDGQRRDNAISAMKIEEDHSRIFAQFDSTFWGGAREGFVITAKGVYAKEYERPPVHWQWDEIEYVWEVENEQKIEINGYWLVVDGEATIRREIVEGIRLLITKARINAGVSTNSSMALQKSRLLPWYKKYEELLDDPGLKKYASDIPFTVVLLKQKATDMNDPIAQYALAYILLANRSICADEVGSARDWLRKAAAQGMVLAIRMLYSFRKHPEYLFDSDVVKRLHASYGST